MRRASLAAALLLLAASSLASQATGKVALVIGNGAYQSSPLRNPPNDARDVAGALEGLGFRATLLVDADREAMEKAIRAFGSDLRSAQAGLFYFAGHGIQARGRNFLIPVRADIADADEVTYKAVDAELVLSKMESSGCPVNIVMLDACRNNPFPGADRGAERGLAVVGRQPVGSLLVFATGPGQTAKDGEGANGIFTKHLLRNIKTPGIDIEILMRRVRDGVLAETGGAQVPWTNSSLTGEGFSFLPIGGSAADAPATAPAAASAATAPAALAQARGDAKISVLATGTLYVDGFERGRVAGGNSVAVEGLRAGRVKAEMRYADGRNEELFATVPAGGSVEIAFKTKELVALGIKLVPVPGGTFTMGTSEVKEARQHKVTLDGFRMGAYEVTQEQFRRVMQVASLPLQSAEGDRYPVANLTWYAAIVFCNKASILEGLEPAYSLFGYGADPASWPGNWVALRGKQVKLDLSANGYRLPTEAEWEYAARGGPNQGKTHYPGGMLPGDLGWFKDNSGGVVHEVGRKIPNGLGLYDLAGNVAEMVWDWAEGNYPEGPQANPVGPAEGFSPSLRGGDFSNDSARGKVYARSWWNKGAVADGRTIRSSGLGFRVVRSGLD